MYEHYIAVPFLFVNYGEEKNPRKAALLGHALFHGAKDKCMTDVREYSAKEACLVEPILRVQGRGEQWFSFRGKLITNVACLLVRDELARRVLMESGDSACMRPDNTSVDFDEIVRDVQQYSDFRMFEIVGAWAG